MEVGRIVLWDGPKVELNTTVANFVHRDSKPTKMSLFTLRRIVSGEDEDETVDFELHYNDGMTQIRWTTDCPHEITRAAIASRKIDPRQGWDGFFTLDWTDSGVQMVSTDCRGRAGGLTIHFKCTPETIASLEACLTEIAVYYEELCAKQM